MTEFIGVFADLLASFVIYKRSLGLKYTTETDELTRFASFTKSFPLSKPILTKKLVQAWCAKREGEGVRNNQRRICVVRQFALYLNDFGHEAYIPPPSTNAGRHTFIPYIFTHAEIERIFANSDKLCPRRNSTIAYVIPIILRVLYSCGIRISEAVSLQNKHVDLREGILEIKNSKFGKDRLVPMSESTAEVCRRYYQILHRHSSLTEYFFMQFSGRPVTRDNVYRRFREVLWESGISHGGKGIGPRVHDLRHTFAVHALKRAVDRGIDIDCVLPILSTYMGHASVTATEQYVRLTTDAFPEIRAVLDRTCGHVVPEVVWE
jgi:integrase